MADLAQLDKASGDRPAPGRSKPAGFCPVDCHAVSAVWIFPLGHTKDSPFIEAVDETALIRLSQNCVVHEVIALYVSNRRIA